MKKFKNKSTNTSLGLKRKMEKSLVMNQTHCSFLFVQVLELLCLVWWILSLTLVLTMLLLKASLKRQTILDLLMTLTEDSFKCILMLLWKLAKKNSKLKLMLWKLNAVLNLMLSLQLMIWKSLLLILKQLTEMHLVKISHKMLKNNLWALLKPYLDHGITQELMFTDKWTISLIHGVLL